MFATKEEFAKAKVHSVIMVQGNPAQGFPAVGSAHRMWLPEPKRIEVYELPNDNDPPAVSVKRFPGTKQEFSEEIPDPDRIGLRSLREMKSTGSRLSIWGDGESIGVATAAEVATAKGEVSRLAAENVDLKTENTRLQEELEAALADLEEARNAGTAKGGKGDAKDATKVDPPAPDAAGTAKGGKGK
jgi:hypothetical protein